MTRKMREIWRSSWLSSCGFLCLERFSQCPKCNEPRPQDPRNAA